MKGVVVNCTLDYGPWSGDQQPHLGMGRWKQAWVDPGHHASLARQASQAKISQLPLDFRSDYVIIIFLEHFLRQVFCSVLFRDCFVSGSLRLCKLGTLSSHFPKRNWGFSNVPSVTSSLSLSVIELDFEPRTLSPGPASLSTIRTFALSYAMEPTTWILLKSVFIMI